MNSNKTELLHKSFNGIKQYTNEFLEYTKELETDNNSISRERVEMFIANIKTMLDQIEADIEQKNQ